MKKTMENRLSMLQAVLAACAKFIGIWTPLTAFKAAHDELKGNVNGIELASQTQEEQLKGFAEDKGLKKDAMIKKALAISYAVFAFADAMGDVVLREKMNYSYSDISLKRDSIVAQICQGIHDVANGLIANLSAYGLVPADVAAQQVTITAYKAVITAPRGATAVRKAATAEIEVLIRNSMKILSNQMDKMMPEYQTSNPAFFSEYFTARMVVDNGAAEKKKPAAPAKAA